MKSAKWIQINYAVKCAVIMRKCHLLKGVRALCYKSLYKGESVA